MPQTANPCKFWNRIVILEPSSGWPSQAAMQSKDPLPACAATGPSGNFLFRERRREGPQRTPM